MKHTENIEKTTQFFFSWTSFIQSIHSFRWPCLSLSFSTHFQAGSLSFFNMRCMLYIFFFLLSVFSCSVVLGVCFCCLFDFLSCVFITLLLFFLSFWRSRHVPASINAHYSCLLANCEEIDRWCHNEHIMKLFKVYNSNFISGQTSKSIVNNWLLSCRLLDIFNFFFYLLPFRSFVFILFIL